MNLPPNEANELAEIESHLAESDPSLWTMFAVFSADLTHVWERSLEDPASSDPASPDPLPPTAPLQATSTPTLPRPTVPPPARPTPATTGKIRPRRREGILIVIFLVTCLLGCVVMAISAISYT